MKKKKVYNIILFALGLTLLSFGIILVLKSQFGVSVTTSVPTVYSEKFTNISFGSWNYIIQGTVTLMLIIFTRKIKINYIMSFLVAFIFGNVLDLFGMLLAGLSADTMLIRIFFFVSGTLIISMALALLMKSNYPVLPFETFIKEISIVKNLEVSKVKTYFDLSCLTISIVSSFIFFGKLKVIGIGTVISAFVFGTLIGICMDILNNNIEGSFIMDEEKVDGFLNKSLIG